MKKILLLVFTALVVVLYAYPCLILPLGSYKYEYEDLLGEKHEVSVSFGFNGKAKFKSGDTTNELNYKLKGTQILVSEDEEFGNEDDFVIEIGSFDNIYVPDLVGCHKATNQIAMWSGIGLGVINIVLILSLKKKRR